MDNPSLTKKRKITTTDGDMLDLSLPTVNVKLMTQVENMHYVADEETMRLDIIANKYYGWCDKLDAILWANNIYNPFSINAGDWLIIPRVKDTSNYAVNPTTSTITKDDTQTANSKITNSASVLNASGKEAKTDRLNKKDMKKSNEQSSGKTNKQINGAAILLG